MLEGKITKIQTGLNKERFKKEWSFIESEGVKRIIEELFKGEIIADHDRVQHKINNYEALDKVMGFVDETINNTIHGLGCANDFIYINSKEYISSFVIYADKLILITQDEDENFQYYWID